MSDYFEIRDRFAKDLPDIDTGKYDIIIIGGRDGNTINGSSILGDIVITNDGRFVCYCNRDEYEGIHPSVREIHSRYSIFLSNGTISRSCDVLICYSL